MECEERERGDTYEEIELERDSKLRNQAEQRYELVYKWDDSTTKVHRWKFKKALLFRSKVHTG